ncbi:MAG: DUF2207 domain-containing protein [Caldilineaceae bacterium]|nr:DUF2207 domain-containing protein [Caldilineaceae bacterium]
MSHRITLQHYRGTRLVIIGLLLLALLPIVPFQTIYAQDVPIVYEHFNTDLTLAEDGALHVRMVQQIRFDDVFRGAFYAIPTSYTTSIANIQLYGAESEADNYELDTIDLVPIAPNFIEDNGDEILVDWDFPPTSPGDVRLFVLEYEAFGVVGVYPQEDSLRWQAVNADRSGITVNDSTVTLTLPDIIPTDQVTATSAIAGEQVERRGQTFTFVTGEPLPDGLPFEIEVAFPHGLLPVNIQEWQRRAGDDALALDIARFHTDLTLNADGTLSVHEETTLDVTAGALYQGFRALSLQYIDDVNVTAVTVNDQPLEAGNGDCVGCYVINTIPRPRNWVHLDPETEQLTIEEENAGVYNIDWYTALPVQAGETANVAVDYEVGGALRVTDEDQLLTWQVVPNYGQPVQQASLRLILPPRVDADEITVEGPREQGAAQLQPDGSLLYTFDGPVVPDAWQVAITLPADATSAAPPLWQQQFEEVMAQADAATVARARSTLIQRVLGILAIVGTLIAAIIAWMRWGRRKVKETLSGYVSEPPSRLSPAMVSFLVDRKATEQGILGSIFYLASFKLIEIDLQDGIQLRRISDEPLPVNPRLKDAYGQFVPIERHLKALYDQVLLPGLPLNQWVTLESISPLLRAKLPEIYALLGSDVQRFFVNVPGSRGEAVPGMLWLLVYGTLLGLMFIGWLPWFVGFGIGFVALIIFVAWSAIHETTQTGYSDMGAQEADRWRRFKTYLLDIKKFGDLAAAQEIIDRYFGYAVALGVENVVLAQAAEMGGLRPIWMPTVTQPTHTGQANEPLPRPPNTNTTSGGLPSSRPRPSTPRIEPQRPTLAGMSAQLGDSIRQASRSMGSLLSTAAGDAASTPRSVVLNSQLRRREIEWKPNTSVSTILDDILRQSVSDAREIQAREVARRQAARASSSSGSGSGWGDWGSSGSGGSRSSSRSSGGFGRSSSGSSRSSSSSRSSNSSRSSSSSSSRSSSSSSRSGGGGRSGFR